MNESDINLIGEQFGHAVDLIRGHLAAIEKAQEIQKETLLEKIAQLEKVGDDHEARIRDLQDLVVSQRTILGLAQGGTSVMSLIALMKALLGG